MPGRDGWRTLRTGCPTGLHFDVYRRLDVLAQCQDPTASIPSIAAASGELLHGRAICEDGAAGENLAPGSAPGSQFQWMDAERGIASTATRTR